ncbi:MAG: hypothetical protein K2K97_04845 [Muribaculaceae bacterium]|nr:hypothetical protein [Muribaculaceae bacterium]
MEELEIMRGQLEALKQQLATQQIINKDLMRKVMRDRSSWLNRLVNIEIILLPLTYLLFAAMCASFGISQWYALSFLILGAIDTAFDWYFVRIPPQIFSTYSIVELHKFLLRQKKGRFVQTCISLPIALVWIVLFLCAVAGDDRIFAYVTSIMGVIAGVVAVYVIYRKMQSTNDALLRDIRDLETDI